ncbi:MAG: PHP domain-containing protein [Deltaproteobacteria bacterium]|nr:PHP domain-containing protein [Deltaproteobacteria bacterium]
MLKCFKCDLHVHTCLSPCADLDMYPGALVNKFIDKNLDIVAICDHNASENVPYVQKIADAKDNSITILPGMEVSSREEVHILAIFDNYDDLGRLQQIVYNHLPGKNDESRFGLQVIVNELDEVEGYNDKLLIGATQLSLSSVVDHIHSFGGLAVAAHIDRESYSVISQLGFIDPSTPFDALEVSASMDLQAARLKYPELSAYALVQSSDAHFIKDVGRGLTSMFLESASTKEIKLAFENRLGRYIQE